MPAGVVEPTSATPVYTAGDLSPRKTSLSFCVARPDGIAAGARLDGRNDMLTAMLGAVSQGILWGIMVLGVFITYKLLDIPDLTVDGSFATGGAVCAVLVVAGVDPAPLRRSPRC